jgi:hypothetical protein
VELHALPLPKTPDASSESGQPAQFEETHWEEYKILQAKVDKQGEFRFHIKGWAVTLVLVVGGSAIPTSVPPPLLLLLLVPLVLFHCLERYQSIYDFRERMRTLENLLERGSDPELWSPQIVQCAARAHARARATLRGSIVLWIESHFYAILCVLVAIASLAKGIVDTLPQPSVP